MFFMNFLSKSESLFCSYVDLCCRVIQFLQSFMAIVNNNLSYFEQMSITPALRGKKLVVFILYSENALRVQSTKYTLKKKKKDD